MRDHVLKFETISLCVAFMSVVACTAQSNLDDAKQQIALTKNQLIDANEKISMLQQESKKLKDQLEKASQPEPPVRLSIHSAYTNANNGYIELSNCSANDMNIGISVIRPSESTIASDIDHFFRLTLNGGATTFLDKRLNWAFASGDQITIKTQKGYKTMTFVLP